jgi:hypothetical protein
VFQASALLVCAFHETLKKKFGSKHLTLILTGGHAVLIAPFLRGIRPLHVDSLFTLKSMNRILEKNIHKS